MRERAITALLSMGYGAMGAAVLFHWPQTAPWLSVGILLLLVAALACFIVKIVKAVRAP